MLKNPVYCGLIVHNKQVYKGNFTALVSEELWHSVQDTLRGKRKAVPKKTVDDSFRFAGSSNVATAGQSYLWQRQR